MMKLIKKHAGGGWLKDKAGKDRIGYWDYSDGPKDIQKKIARYYIDFEEKNAGDLTQVQKYLKRHPELTDYLDKVYAKGINWKALKALGNTSRYDYLSYLDSDGNTHWTQNAGDRNKWALNLGYKDFSDFLSALEASGYNVYNDGTYIYREDPDGNSYQYYAGYVPGKGISYTNGDGAIAGVTKAALDALKKKRERLARREAYRSPASSNWAKVASQLWRTGSFYDDMLKAGYEYNPHNGEYTKNKVVYTVDDQGRVFKKGKAGITQVEATSLFN